tara:strand:+ start:428 stop:721 length:294 start_codon:yes stop_codon:yes gene_type:complete
MATKIKWEDADFLWNDNPYTWDEVELVAEVVNAGDSFEKLPEKKKKKFIELVCRIKGIKVYSGKKPVREDIKITAEDIKLAAKEVLGIDLTVENIHV